MPRPDLSEDVIAERVASVLGTDQLALAPIAQGEDSLALGVEAAGKSYVVRINRLDEGFRKERYVHRRFSSVKLPVPRVLEVGSIGEGLYFCVSERAPGETLQDQQPADVAALVGPLFEVWAELRRCDVSDTSGFGWFDDRGKAYSSSWQDYLRAEADGWEENREQGKQLVGRDPGDLLELYRLLIDSCPEERKLVHGDFGSNNVVVDQGRVTAVLDWDHAMYGDPLFDVATARFWATWLECMAQQTQVFDERLSHLPNYEDRVLCYALYTGFHMFLEGGEHRLMEGGAPIADDIVRWAETRCREVAAGRL
ncbi:MAG TPA: phosphotransferase [Dehalococcoidia bacterium]|nr:phosphotransferase [Dehalococcoidia bacterium]